MVRGVLCAALCSMVGFGRYEAAERRTKCRTAVIAVYGRTPRGGTAGHVATRRGLDRIHTARRPPRGPLRGRGQPGGGPADGAGLDRGATRRSGGLGRTPLPCREAKPAAAEGAPRRKPGSRPLPESARRSRRVGRQRKVRRRAVTQHVCGFVASRESRRRIAHHNLATPRPPRLRGARPYFTRRPTATSPGRGRRTLSPLFRSPESNRPGGVPRAAAWP